LRRIADSVITFVHTEVPDALPRRSSAHAGAFAALAFHHPVAFLDQAFAFAILANLLFLDVGAFLIGHKYLQVPAGSIIAIVIAIVCLKSPECAHGVQ
jgi:hypothetical protein